MAESCKRILIVGGGKMGSAILAGWVGSSDAPADSIEASRITVVEPTAERRAYLADAFGVRCAADAAQVQDTPDVVVLAVKPQVMMKVLEGIAQQPAFQGGADGPLFVSIAAGLTTRALEAALPEGAALVRVMPNMPLSIGAGASGVCAGSRATAGQVQLVADLFGCLGRAVVVPESDMDVVCALSGSGPAYVVAMVESLRDAAVNEGLDAQLAEALALQTVLGTARLVSETGADLAEVRASVCSPGGTTVAALDAMAEAGFDQVFQAGVSAAVTRSKELSRCTS